MARRADGAVAAARLQAGAGAHGKCDGATVRVSPGAGFAPAVPGADRVRWRGRCSLLAFRLFPLD